MVILYVTASRDTGTMERTDDKLLKDVGVLFAIHLPYKAPELLHV